MDYKIKINELELCEIEMYSNMINSVFDEFVGKDYSDEGKNTFKDFMNIKNVLERLKNNSNKAFVAKYENEFIGILEIKNNEHISLFFVKKEFHKSGVGRKLFEYFLRALKQNNNDIKTISVNSSIYAEQIYTKLGFMKIGNIQEKNGIKYIPMEYKI